MQHRPSNRHEPLPPSARVLPEAASVTRIVLALVAMSTGLGAVLAHRLGFFLEYWTPASFALVGRLALFVAFLLAVWWRVPWLATSSILGFLFVLSGGGHDPMSVPALASVAIALFTGAMLDRVEKAYGAAAGDEREPAAPLRLSHPELRAELERLRADNRNLAARNRSLEEFSYVASHDLKSPLRAIHGFGQALLDEHSEALDEHARLCVERMQSAAVRLESTVNALLGLARVSNAPLVREEVDITAIVREALSELSAADPSRRLELHSPETLVVRGDPALLRIAVTNIVANAWKFTRPRPLARIEVGRSATARGTALYIRDNGVGFDPRGAASMFRPFKRLHSAHEFEGSGIGLATVERVVARHDGQVWAEGCLDRGAAIFLQLPD